MTATPQHGVVSCLVLEGTCVPPGAGWLGEREHEVLSRMRFTRRRESWRLGRWTAKVAVSRALEGALYPGDVDIIAAPDGAPEAHVGGRPLAVQISISHSDGVAMCAVAPADIRVGCDVETVAERPAVFVDDYFTGTEAQWVRSLAPTARACGEALVWSAKESALKWLRDGMRRDTRDVVVAPVANLDAQEWGGVRVSVGDGQAQLWGWWRRNGARVFTVVTDTPCAAPSMLAAPAPGEFGDDGKGRRDASPFPTRASNAY